MVSTYLAVFYMDVVGLAPAAVSLLMLVAKVPLRESFKAILAAR